MPKRPTTPRGGGAKMPALVGSLLAETRVTAAKRANIALDWEAWREVVGDRIARRTRPGALRDGELTIYSESPVWAQELSLLSDEIVTRLRARGVAVATIRFRAGSVRRSDRPPTPPMPPPELPDDVRQNLEQIEDPALRETIAEAAAHSLAHRERREATPKRAARAPRSAAQESAPSDQAAARPSARW